MSLVRVNHFSDVTWYAHLWDVLMLAIFIFAVHYAYHQFKNGNRLYVLLIVTAFFYGFMLETSGMLWHSSYTQGEFLVMLHFTQFEAFKHSTDMPFYVLIFYPTLLFLACKFVEPFHIQSDFAKATTLDLFCVLIDVPYILQGGQDHVVWWTWHEWKLYQHWLTWPIVDGWWEATWHPLLFWLVLKSVKRFDRYVCQAQVFAMNKVKAFILFADGVSPVN